MTRGLIITLALALAGCLGRYTPGPDPQPAPPAHSQPSPSTPSSPSPSPSPAPSPPQTPTPPPSDAGAAPTPPPADGGTSSPCAQLDACCQLLPSDQVQGCLDQVAGLDDGVCQGILDQLQQNGYCP